MDAPLELRQLRYFVAVAEELHFGRAAERLHMSQSPLSRAIRELERELGLVLFVRTTRRVELTPAGSALLERARRALAEIDAAVEDARRAAEPEGGLLGVGYTPFTRLQATRIAEEVQKEHPELQLRFEEDVTTELLRQIAGHELAAAVVMETPAAAQRHAFASTRCGTNHCSPRFRPRMPTRRPRRSRSAPLPRSVFCCRASRPGAHSTRG
jgi:DNA-binding transcriptional LysR family regulator